MRLNTILLAVLTVADQAIAKFSPRRQTGTGSSDFTPRRYIVELKSRAHGTHVAKKIANIDGLRIVKTFDTDIFPAVSIECDRACDAASVAAALDNGEDTGYVATVFKSTPVRLGRTIPGESYSDDAAASNYSVHGLTGVDKLHDAGIIGTGAIVAIVDSGVQYTHPALGGGIGPNYTVVGGYDLVGDNWPNTAPEPDNDPMDDYGHGTHVAGIIAGKSDQFVGVAPGAKILAFKVFGSSGYSDEETVIEGFLKAFDSGADIITASLGEKSGWTSNAWAVVASRMVDQGVVVTIAAGNDGQDGAFDMSNGASGEHVLTIAASDPDEFPAQEFNANFILGGEINSTTIAYYGGSTTFPTTVVDWPVVPLTLNASVEADACSPLLNNTANMTGTIVLIRYGGCPLYTKHENIAAFSPQYILFYEDEGPYQNPITGVTPGLTSAIEANAGAAIVNTILAGGNVTASFNVTDGHYVGLYNAGGGRPALYSSWGTTFDLALKPDIAAPGTDILSTYPTDAYQVLSGTSMATPYIAGVAALYVGKFGGRAAHADDPAWAQRLHARIMSTAHAVPWADWSTSATDYGFYAPTTQVGAGFVDAVKLLNYTTELSFDGRKFELNDTAHFQGSRSVVITNTGSEAVTYTFDIQPAGGYEPWTPLPPNTTLYGVPGFKLYPDIAPEEMVPGVALPEALTIAAGESATAEFTFTVPEGISASNLPVYSGKILISGDNGEDLGIPYFGVGGSLSAEIQNVWDYGRQYPIMTSGIYDTTLSIKSNFTFNLSTSAQDFPKVLSELVWGTEELRWDIFDANYTEVDWVYPPIPGQNGFIGSATSWNGTDLSEWFDPAKDSEDDIFSFPLYRLPRDTQSIYYWLGRYANGTQVQSGSYQFRLAALRPFGDPSNAADWDIWPTPSITFLP
ncbi:peptidase S8/S53 domain-containing protein [Xylariales sp. PMI_506]|nr:peptidase S8/S53 domain-containing protein [Xylariales sp. PMI_506]